MIQAKCLAHFSCFLSSGILFWGKDRVCQAKWLETQSAAQLHTARTKQDSHLATHSIGSVRCNPIEREKLEMNKETEKETK